LGTLVQPLYFTYMWFDIMINRMLYN